MPDLRPAHPLHPTRLLASLLLLLLLLPGLAAADPDAPDGAVTLPLTHWEQLLDRIEEGEQAPVPPATVVRVDRRLEGSFMRGVFTGTLDTRFRLLEGAESASPDAVVRVPVLDAATSIDQVLLDGQPTSLLQEGSMYTVGVSGAGEHRVQLRFFQGREDDRFSRELRFALPPSGPTAVSIWVPEQDIEAHLAGGAITATRAKDSGTDIQGHLDSRGLLDLSWTRKATHRGAGELRAEASMNALFTLHEALVKGVATVSYTLLEGETDRLELDLPPDIEVVDVTGDAVLQWYTDQQPDSAQGPQLAVLLRYLVEAGRRAEGHDRATLQIHFQFPVDLEQPVPLHLPMPTGDVLLTGAIGVQGPAGLEAAVANLQQAEQLTLRDLPSDLLALTPNPLLLGFSFQQPPSVTLSLTRQGELELTSTLVDDIQASTVLMEDGAEVTKLRLRMRNNTRQHLAVRLPADSTLTHALLDGHPVRPAVLLGEPTTDDGLAHETLLLPLRQSERSSDGGVVIHQVSPGETLGGIALHYYSDSTRWYEILQHNSDLLGAAEDLEVGHQLRIPLPHGVEESSFVLELAYKRKQPDTGLAGIRDLRLPGLDVDTISVTWHLYLPSHLTPLGFSANLTQYDAIHYDPFQRLLGVARHALLGGDAWAGGGSYESILSQRKAIYQEESNRKQGGEDVVSSFPLVGERYRFERILAGDDVPHIAVAYVADSMLPWLRWAALAAAFGLCLLLVGGRSSQPGPGRWVRRAGSLLGFVLLFVLAHHVLGVHRRIVWGCDLALAVSLLSGLGRGWLSRLRAALSTGPIALLTWRNVGLLLGLEVFLLVLLGWPLFASCTLLIALAIGRGVSR